MADQFDYDVFLCYSPRDNTAWRKVARRLKRDGLKVCPHEWQTKGDGSIREKSRRGLEGARVLVLVMTPALFESNWADLEPRTLPFRTATDDARRFVPVLAADVEIPDTIGQFTYVDWRRPTDEAYARLLAACRAGGEADATRPSDLKEASRILSGHTNWVWACAVTPDGRRVMSGSSDRTLKVWDLQSGQELATLSGHKREVRACAVTPDGRRVVSGSSDLTLMVWELHSGQELGMLSGHVGSVFACAVTPDGRRVVSGSGDGTLKVWALATGRCEGTFEGHTDFVMTCAVTPDGRRVVSGSADHTLRVWDLPKREEVGAPPPAGTYTNA